MIKVTSKTIKALQSGELKKADYAQELVNTYPASELAAAFVELLAMKDAPIVSSNKISVSADELSAITDLFRVKGSSNRGRKKKGA